VEEVAGTVRQLACWALKQADPQKLKLPVDLKRKGGWSSRSRRDA